ncbi:hypothetical protein FG384_15720 [Psychrobacillus vulpis]|uniref:Uncharacterized protein n=2 Tax=Psychrobacillus vulpis TaxID=2325572 RepID=A0A544TMU0_9BACI|nr:hypothetical protein FG384_15720 [Psychrobacillus vulpis]
MSKIELMDRYIYSFEEQISSSEICKFVDTVFGINLESVLVLDKKSLQAPSSNNMDQSTMSPSRTVIDSYLDLAKHKMTGMEIRKMLNQIFGINLDGISALEKERISLFSKGQWVVQNAKDLFIIHTGIEDVDVTVLPSIYFMEHSGLEGLPSELQNSLSHLGYNHDKKIRGYYFSNPSGMAVTDQFKGQTIGAIIEVIRKSYSDL